MVEHDNGRGNTDVAGGDTTNPGGALKTSISRGWLFKFGLFALVGLVFFAWGMYDGAYLYPKRGESHARYMLWQYLQVLESKGRLSARSASVSAPAEEIESLRSADEELDEIEAARLQWLTSISRVRSLDSLAYEDLSAQPSPSSPDVNYITTAISDPSATLVELNTDLGGTDVPKALAFYDIPSQYIIAAVGLLAFLGVGYRILQTMATSFTYDPASHRLKGPGIDITPEQLAELDKAKWHKYFATVVPKGGAPERRLDLYRFVPLEDWVLEIEKLSDSCEIVLASNGAPIVIQVIDVLTGVVSPVDLEDDYDGKPLLDAAGRAVCFPVFQDVGGVWRVYDHRALAALRSAASDGGEFADHTIYVDPATAIAKPTMVEEDVADGMEDADQPVQEDDQPSTDA